ncbi:MAG: DNA polymerase III subunit gamma/tau [Anaerolineae bacterium]|jgi:DNA polymerase-3 subunit gamma/tau
MTTQALYLKYRPQTFEEVVGQEPITQTLRNALRQGRLRHAYLFTGPRGTGKTTTARLLSKAVNCHAPKKERPCNECPICIAINEGRLLDLIEIDAASNRGIDEIRDIREKVGFRPSEGRFKVYVLDEAHMLTEQAFNALLKTLEEPPPHVIFALVTTDPHKIPATITSRCQRFDFKRIRMQAIIDRLAYVAEQEGLTVEPAALELIARQGAGALRDAISLLDQLTSYGDEITLDQVQMVLGTVAGEAAGKVAACLASGDVTEGLGLINDAVNDGADPRQFSREVVEYLRGLLLVKKGAGTQLLNVTAEQSEEMTVLAERMPMELLLRAIHLFNEAATDLRRGLQTVPQLPLEMALVESIVEQKAPMSPASLGESDSQSATSPSQPASKPQAQRVAEQPAPSLTQTADVQAQPPKSAEPESTSQASAEALSLGQVVRAWDRILQTVRQHNPTAEGALRSGCEPVEVNGNEIVVTFPYPFLREKLGDPQRKMEIQDALTKVLDTKCRLELVLASEYTPRQQTPAPEKTPVAVAADDGVPDPISRWAEEHGGEASIIQP